MALKNSVSAIPMLLFNSANLVNGTFLPCYAPLPHGCFITRILNLSNIIVYISYDGVTYHDVILPEELLTYYWQQLSQPSGKVALMKEGTHVYLMGDPTAANGLIYLCGYYQQSL